MAVIEATGLVKTFRTGRGKSARSVRAVSGIGFSVEGGERLAYIGPNGAGKSTSIKILTGILHPDEGRAEVLGLVPWKQRRQLALEIGTLFGQRSQLWLELPARESLALLGSIYRLGRDRVRPDPTIGARPLQRAACACVVTTAATTRVTASRNARARMAEACNDPRPSRYAVLRSRANFEEVPMAATATRGSETAGAARWSPARVYLVATGVFLTGAAAAGFGVSTSFPSTAAAARASEDAHIYGIFETNGWHNLTTLVSGAISLGLAARPRWARAGAFAKGALYAVVTVAIAVWGAETFLLASNAADQVVHASLAVAGLGAAAATPRSLSLADISDTVAR